MPVLVLPLVLPIEKRPIHRFGSSEANFDRRTSSYV